ALAQCLSDRRRCRGLRKCQAVRWRTFQLFLQHDAASPHGFAASLEATSPRRPPCNRRCKVAAGLFREPNSAVRLMADETDPAWQPIRPTLGAPRCPRRRLPNGGVSLRFILHLLGHKVETEEPPMMLQARENVVHHSNLIAEWLE